MTVAPLLQLQQLTVEGSPRAMGLAHGEHLRPTIQAFVQMRFDALRTYVAEWAAMSWAPRGIDGIYPIGRACLDRFKAWDHDGYVEHCGIAEGAGVDPLHLYIAANMTDTRDALLFGQPGPPGVVPPADNEGCSTLMVPSAHTAGGQPLVGQTWDLNPQDLDYVVAIHRRPTEGLQTWSVTCSGCLSLVGMNERGLCVGTTNVKTWGARPGLGYMNLLHRLLRCPDVQTAARWIEEAKMAGAHTYWVADAQQQVEWEVSPDGFTRRDTTNGPIQRTNHCLAAVNLPLEVDPPNASSLRRYDRIGEVLSDAPATVEGLRTMFGDRSDGLLSVNRYAEDNEDTATNAVFIGEPATRTLHACRGSADRGEWIRFQFC